MLGVDPYAVAFIQRERATTWRDQRARSLSAALSRSPYDDWSALRYAWPGGSCLGITVGGQYEREINGWRMPVHR